MRVLLVEDNPGDADLVREALGEHRGDLQLEHVTRLAEAVSALRSSHPEVVLLDLSLPDASGLQGVTQLVRLRPDVPVVVLTSLSEADAGTEAMRQGAQDYLTKNEIDDRVLGRVLRYAVERHALALRSQLLAGEQAARAVAEEARFRAVLLADASVAVSSDLEEEQALSHLARVLVPRLASLCAVEWMSTGGQVRRLLAAGNSPHCQIEIPAASPDAAGALRSSCLRGARLEPPSARIVAAWRDALPDVEATEAMTLPLRIRGEPLGALTLAAARRYKPEDLSLGEEIARRAAAAVECARLYSQAVEAVRIRDDFISIAGHELRTPLAALLLDAHRLSLVRDLDRESLRRGLERITRVGERLRDLVSDLLDVARIRAGGFLLEVADVELGALVREVAYRFAPALDRANAQLRLSDGPPVHGRWDRSRIQQVVANLLQNAVRYGDCKPIEITVEARGGAARLRVRDHGCGIAPGEQAHLFEQFSRRTELSKREGLGLGLWLSRVIVESHGGSISVESQLGSGAEFRVDLPCAGPPAARSALEEACS